MTQIVVRNDLANGIVAGARLAGLPAPTSFGSGVGPNPQTTIEWVPDLSPADQTTLAAVQKLAIGATLITKAERDSIEPDIANGRQFLQATKAQYLALTQVQRDGIEFDNLTSIWRILRVILRD